MYNLFSVMEFPPLLTQLCSFKNTNCLLKKSYKIKFKQILDYKIKCQNV